MTFVRRRLGARTVRHRPFGRWTSKKKKKNLFSKTKHKDLVMAVDITSIEINKYNIQNYLCSYWLSRGDPEGKQIPLLGPPLIHDNIRCMTVPIRNKDLGRKTKHATLVQHEMFM